MHARLRGPSDLLILHQIINRTRFLLFTVVPRPLSNDPQLFQCIYRYSHASKRFVEV